VGGAGSCNLRSVAARGLTLRIIFHPLRFYFHAALLLYQSKFFSFLGIPPG
jgi:hypothetical protein